jgi:hypothetical protein
VDNPRLLDTYVGVSFGKWTGTLGKQSLWWGPDTGGAFQYTNNIEPIWMARLTNDKPYKIPVLGKLRLDMFYGKLQGHTFEPQVWIHGEKVTLQPTKSLEFGFTRTVVFLGVDYPLSFHRLLDSYFSVGDQRNTYLAANNPGSRQGGFEVSWKLPKVPAKFYMDSYCDDEPSPLASLHRSAFRPGLYFAQLPGPLAKMDLRMEGGYTASENDSWPNGNNYWKEDYRDGYTNKGLLIGDTMGRAGVTWQAWSTYWLSPRDKIQVSYRNEYVSPQFLAGGATQNDIRGTSNFLLKQHWEVALGVQSERVVMPLLTNSLLPKYNVSGWAGVTYWPDHKVEAQ